MSHLAKKTETPGRFVFHSQRKSSCFCFHRMVRLIETHRTLFLLTKCVRFDQVGKMTMTCAWLTPNLTSTRSFTPSRPREMCLMFSTNFTVRARFLHNIDEMFFTNMLNELWMCHDHRSYHRNYWRLKGKIQAVLFGHRHPWGTHCHTTTKRYSFRTVIILIIHNIYI